MSTNANREADVIKVSKLTVLKVNTPRVIFLQHMPSANTGRGLNWFMCARDCSMIAAKSGLAVLHTRQSVIEA